MKVMEWPLRGMDRPCQTYFHTSDIERRKVRADLGINYDSDTSKQIDNLRAGVAPAS